MLPDGTSDTPACHNDEDPFTMEPLESVEDLIRMRTVGCPYTYGFSRTQLCTYFRSCRSRLNPINQLPFTPESLARFCAEVQVESLDELNEPDTPAPPPNLSPSLTALRQVLIEMRHVEGVEEAQDDLRNTVELCLRDVILEHHCTRPAEILGILSPLCREFTGDDNIIHRLVEAIILL